MIEERFCPNCGSKKVEPDSRHTNVLGEIIANQNKWLCNECGYSGWMPVGEDEDMEFDEQEQPEIDTDLGTGYGKYIIYVTIPVLIIYILIRLILN